MSKTKREIDCLARLQTLTGQTEDILQFLKLENLINDGQLRAISLAADKAKELQQLISSLKREQKFQLIEYSWSLLPVENIDIVIVTEKNAKTFSFHGG